MSTKTKRSTKKSTAKKDAKAKAATATTEDTKATPATEEEGASPQGEVSPTCPSCGATMVLRSGKFGAFYGCTNYKSGTCKATLPIEQ